VWGLSSDQQINITREHTVAPAGIMLCEYNALHLIKYSLQGDLYYVVIKRWANSYL
jgi:hypothetical protein